MPLSAIRCLPRQHTQKVNCSVCGRILAMLPVNVFVYDIPSSSIHYWNHSLIEQLGYDRTPGVVRAEMFRDIIHPDDFEKYHEMERALADSGDGATFAIEQRMRHADGSWRWIGTNFMVFNRDARGVPVQLLGVGADVTRARRRREQLRRDACYDPLTRLVNRRHLQNALRRNKSVPAPVGSLCICDIDRFKMVNDTYGHSTGDDVLRGFAAILSATVRREEIVARMGGDEFCIVFPGLSVEQALIAVERIRRKLARTRFTAPDGRRFAVTASFGLDEMRTGMTWCDVMARADQALYAAKSRGRNRVSPSVLKTPTARARLLAPSLLG